MASNVDASPSSSLVAQERTAAGLSWNWSAVCAGCFGCAGTAAGLSWCWSAVCAGSCVFVPFYLPGRCSEETKSGLRRISEVSSEKRRLNEKKRLL